MEYESSAVALSGEIEIQTEKKVKDEYLWSEKRNTEVKYESEELLQTEGNSLDFALESSSSTVSFNSYDAHNNIEIKEEHWWKEAESVEVKPESRETAIPEMELPIELKVCTAEKQTEENAAVENIASSCRRSRFKIKKNKSVLSKIGNYSQVDATMVDVACECKPHCYDRINYTERKRIMEHFQTLRDSNLQNTYLFNCLKLDELKDKKEEKELSSDQKFSLQYYVQTTEKEMVRVCKTVFLNIHGVQNSIDLIQNIAVVLKKTTPKSSFQTCTIASQKDPTSYSDLQNTAHIRNCIMLFKKRKPFLKVSRPLIWKKKRALAMLSLYRLRLQLLLGRM